MFEARSICRSAQAVYGDLAPFDHQGDAIKPLQNRHIGERIAGDHDEVGELSLRNYAEILLPANAFGGPARRRPQGLERRHSGPNEAGDLDRIRWMTMAAGIGPGGDFDPGRERAPQARGMMLFEMLRALADMRQR